MRFGDGRAHAPRCGNCVDTRLNIGERRGPAGVARRAHVDGKLDVTYEYRGAVAVLLDLHRGKATGTAWSLIIDGVCLLVLIVATTGLILWQSLRGRGHYGLLVLGLGLALGVGVYFAFVP